MNTKYENIQFGQFQGMINYCEASSRLSVLSNKVDNSLKRVGEKLQQAKKTMRDLCSVSTMTLDEEQGELEIYWRTERDPVETKIIVECVKCEGKEIKLSERDTLNVIEELYIELAKS